MSSARSSVADIKPKWEEGCESRVPRYLFKEISNLYFGHVSSAAIIPEALIKKLSRRELSRAPWCLDRNYPPQCSTWKSSLLDVLVHAAEMSERLHEPNVCVCVLDTRKVKRTPIYPATGMPRGFDAFHGSDNSQIHETTYLADGIIRNESEPCFKLISFENLIEYGLFQFLPQLEVWEDGDRAWKKLSFLRSSLFQNPRQITLLELVKAREIATSFGEDFVLPVMVALLSLTGRQRKAWDSFREVLEWSDLVIPEGRLISRRFMFDRNANNDASDLPEIWQFTKVLGDICGYAHPTEYEEESQELLEQVLEEQSVRSEQSDPTEEEQTDKEEDVFEDGVNSLSLAPTKVPSPESEAYHAHQDERGRFPAMYPATPTSMDDGEWETDIHANGPNGSRCI